MPHTWHIGWLTWGCSCWCELMCIFYLVYFYFVGSAVAYRLLCKFISSSNDQLSDLRPIPPSALPKIIHVVALVCLHFDDNKYMKISSNIIYYIRVSLYSDALNSFSSQMSWSPCHGWFVDELSQMCGCPFEPCVWVALWIFFNYMGVIHPVKRIRSDWESLSTWLYPSPIFCMCYFHDIPLAFFHIQVFIHFLRLDIQEETQASSYLVKPCLFDLGRVVIFRCNNASATRA